MRRWIYVALVLVLLIFFVGRWVRRENQLKEYPVAVRELVRPVLSTSDPTEQQTALLACADSLSRFPPLERADIYLTLLRHEYFDASSGLCFIHVALRDRSAFSERASAFQRSPAYASLSKAKRAHIDWIIELVRTVGYDDWTGKPAGDLGGSNAQAGRE